MASNTLRECSVCNEDFNEETRCPRTLPCSHYLCTVCIASLIRNSKRQCPFCRQNFKAKSSEDLMINRAVLDFLGYLITQERNPRESSATIGFLKKEAAKDIESLFSTCEAAKVDTEVSLMRVESMIQSVQISNAEIETVISRLNEIKDENFRRDKALGNKNKRLMKTLRDIAKLEDTICNMKMKLDTCTKTFEETGALIDAAKERGAHIEEWADKFKGFSSTDRERLQVTEKDVFGTQEKIHKISEIVDTMKTEPKKSFSRPEVKPTTSSSASSGQLKVKDLQAMTKKAKNLVRQGRLFAVQNHQGVLRSASISIRDGILLLHCLAENAPPADAVTLEHSEVLEMVITSSRLAFLELRVSDQTLGTLYVRLTPDTQGARQFALLCTGETGPSYAKTLLLGVMNKGLAGEGVRFGDYEKQTGKAGKAVVTGLDSKEEYKRPWFSGTVTGIGWLTKNESVSGQFIIRTKDNPGKVSDSVFGNVEKGLDVLCSAIYKYKKIRSVCIGDCGLALCSVPPK